MMFWVSDFGAGFGRLKAGNSRSLKRPPRCPGLAGLVSDCYRPCGVSARVLGLSLAAFSEEALPSPTTIGAGAGKDKKTLLQ